MPPQVTQQRAFTVIACQAAGCRPATDVPADGRAGRGHPPVPARGAGSLGLPARPDLVPDLAPQPATTTGHGHRHPALFAHRSPRGRASHRAKAGAHSSGADHAVPLAGNRPAGLPTLPARLHTVPPSLRYAGLN
jgi:hypothetical protein